MSLSTSRWDEAEAFHWQALAIRRDLLEPENPYLAHSLYNLGFVLRRRGDLEPAEQYLREAVEIFRKVHGEEHYVTAQGRAGLAGVLLERGAVEEAVRLRRHVVVTSRAV